MRKLKKYEVAYSLKFVNSEIVEAFNKKEAVKKLRELEEANGELDALGGEEMPLGYQIEEVREIK
jgi:hypothetical protein